MTSAIKVKPEMNNKIMWKAQSVWVRVSDPDRPSETRLRHLRCESSRPAITAVLHDKRKMERY